MKAEPSESVLFTAQRGATRRCFVNEGMPKLTKARCSSGGCHSQPEGQSNFIIIFAQKLLSVMCPEWR
jgi:hypothetical protein